jgi:hypothetical protein
MTFLHIPEDIKAQIQLELASLPAIQGKVELLFEFNCGTSGHVESLDISFLRKKRVRPLTK